MMANVSEELARLASLRDQGVLTEAEFEAQKAAVLSGSPAASAPAKKRGGLKKVLLIAGGVILLLMIIGALAGGEAGNEQAASPEDAAATPPLEVTAQELFKAYEANEAAAQSKYGDRPLLVTGTVAGVSLDFADNPVVQLRTSNEFMSAQASLVDASKPKADGLKKGQSVKLRCAGVGEVVGTPMLSDCSIE